MKVIPINCELVISQAVSLKKSAPILNQNKDISFLTHAFTAEQFHGVRGTLTYRWDNSTPLPSSRYARVAQDTISTLNIQFHTVDKVLFMIQIFYSFEYELCLPACCALHSAECRSGTQRITNNNHNDDCNAYRNIVTRNIII